MSKRMLIDSSHPEETRVVVLDGQKVEEFDFEAASKRPLKGNIYLAKVTRVEPSLQAAFVEYGGNRQGFLAFSEIHPDYYQIPVADRMALIAEAEAEARRRQEDDIESFEITSGPKPQRSEEDGDEDSVEASEDGVESLPEAAQRRHEDSNGEEVFSNRGAEPDLASAIGEEGDEEASDDARDAESHDHHEEPLIEPGRHDSETVEIAEAEIAQDVVDQQTVASAAVEIAENDLHSASDISADQVSAASEPEATAPVQAQSSQPLQASRPPQRWMRRRHYKIQEVIKRRQIILVQVVKEERGNKGAALTTYLSLAGRYCVLMPNTPRGGGISRKITNANDRKRLKSAAQSLELPEGMGLIIRTAGENRTKVEIKRDYEYLLRLWDTIRELTLKSNAPSCVYEEGDLIKRAIRDLYNKDVGEVLVEGEDGYRNAKDFMRMLMPSHAKNVKLYKEPVPLFQRHHIEAQLDSMFSPTVTLKSGGYIVINQTEALVSIDVNSGRATREHSIEETAHKTNLEAADEIARQLRLRDLAGLIVIDFIDMEDMRNDRDVERRLRDAVKNDRARVQIGKISQFGLLEMSRQRLRAGVIAGSTIACPHCGGQGIVRSVESTSLRVLRALEEEGQRLRASAVTVRVANDVTIYALNQKRKELARIESDYGMTIAFEPKEGMPAGTFDLERTAQKTAEERAKLAVTVEAGFSPPTETEAETEDAAIEAAIEEEEEIEDNALVTAEPAQIQREHEAPHDDQSGRRRRRRRRRGGRDRERDFGDRSRENPPRPAVEPTPVDYHAQGSESASPQGNGENGAGVEGGERPNNFGQPHADADGQRRRRRRRRGRRGRGGHDQFPPREAGPAQDIAYDRFGGQPDEIDTTPRDEPRHPPEHAPNASSSPVWSFEGSRQENVERPETAPIPQSVPPAPVREEASFTERAVPEPVSHTPPEPEPQPPAQPPQPAKKGWWQRAFRSQD